jgi:hypothetical protein
MGGRAAVERLLDGALPTRTLTQVRSDVVLRLSMTQRPERDGFSLHGASRSWPAMVIFYRDATPFFSAATTKGWSTPTAARRHPT